jgi:hypothetical protein
VVFIPAELHTESTSLFVNIAMLAAQHVTSVGCGTRVTLWFTAIGFTLMPPDSPLLDELDELEPASTGFHSSVLVSHHQLPSSEYWTSDMIAPLL